MTPPIKIFFLVISFFILSGTVGATATGYVTGEVVSGPRDYRETTVDAGFFARRTPVKSGKSKKRPKKSPFVEGMWGFASRSSYGVRNSTQTTVTWMGGVGLDLKNGFGVDGSYWATPGPKNPGDGAYRARGADGGFSSRWRGVIPFARPGRRSIRGFLYLSGGWAVHEEYFVTPLPARRALQWYPIHQSNGGAAVRWTFFNSFTTGMEGRLYRYNRDLQSLSDSLAFMPLSNLGAAGTYELVLGFPEKSWGFKVGQDLWDWGDVTLRWRRTDYVIGLFPWSDTSSASIGVYVWRGCGFRARYEVNKPKGGRAAEYKGFAVELGL